MLKCTKVKAASLLAALLTLSSCGVTEQLARECSGTLESACHLLLGGERADELDDKVTDLRRQVRELAFRDLMLASSIMGTIGSYQREDALIKEAIAALTEQLADALAGGTVTSADVAALQAQLASLQLKQASDKVAHETQITLQESELIDVRSELVALQTGHTIMSVVDPCGPSGGFDEVLLRSGNGQLIASFSQAASGLNTRFAILPPGSYTTTDGTTCAFVVGVDGTVTPSTEE